MFHHFLWKLKWIFFFTFNFFLSLSLTAYLFNIQLNEIIIQLFFHESKEKNNQYDTPIFFFDQKHNCSSVRMLLTKREICLILSCYEAANSNIRHNVIISWERCIFFNRINPNVYISFNRDDINKTFFIDRWWSREYSRWHVYWDLTYQIKSYWICLLWY